MKKLITKIRYYCEYAVYGIKHGKFAFTVAFATLKQLYYDDKPFDDSFTDLIRDIVRLPFRNRFFSFAVRIFLCSVISFALNYVLLGFIANFLTVYFAGNLTIHLATQLVGLIFFKSLADNYMKTSLDSSITENTKSIMQKIKELAKGKLFIKPETIELYEINLKKFFSSYLNFISSTMSGLAAKLVFSIYSYLYSPTVSTFFISLVLEIGMGIPVLVICTCLTLLSLKVKWQTMDFDKKSSLLEKNESDLIAKKKVLKEQGFYKSLKERTKKLRQEVSEASKSINRLKSLTNLSNSILSKFDYVIEMMRLLFNANLFSWTHNKIFSNVILKLFNSNSFEQNALKETFDPEKNISFFYNLKLLWYDTPQLSSNLETIKKPGQVENINNLAEVAAGSEVNNPYDKNQLYKVAEKIEIKKGQITLIKAPSGSGKSLFGQIISNLSSSLKSSIKEENPLSLANDVRPITISNKVDFTIPERNGYTLYEFLTDKFGNYDSFSEDELKIKEYFTKLGFPDIGKALNSKISEFYSGGETVGIMLVKALITDKNLIIIDEGFSKMSNEFSNPLAAKFMKKAELNKLINANSEQIQKIKNLLKEEMQKRDISIINFEHTIHNELSTGFYDVAYTIDSEVHSQPSNSR